MPRGPTIRKTYKSVYLMIFLLAIFSHFITANASFSYPSSGGYGSYGSGSGSYSSSYSKSKSNTMLRDNNVENIKRDSIHRHIMFAVNRMTSLYLFPVIDAAYDFIYSPVANILQVIWNNIFSPVFDMMWKCCSYLNDFMWNNIYDTGYWLYVNTLYPVLVAVQENIYYMIQITSNTLSQLYNFIKPAIIWCNDVVYHFAYSPFINFLHIIWNNISDILSASWDYSVCIASSVMDFWSTFFRYIYDAICNGFMYCWNHITCFICRAFDGIITGVKWCANRLYHYVLKPCGRLLVKIWTDYIKYSLNSIYQFFADLCDNIVEPISNAFIYICDCVTDTFRFMRDYAWQPVFQKLSDVFTTIANVMCDYILTPACTVYKNFFEYFITFWQRIRDTIFEYVLKPLGDCIDTVWTIFIHYMKKIFGKVWGILYLVLRDIFKVIWQILCFIGRSVFGIWDTIHRYLLEINVTKLPLPKNNAKWSSQKPSSRNIGYLNNYEIGVYYATLGGESNTQTVYLSDNQVTDGYIYFWLRNNAKTKRANAKIIVHGNNNVTVYEKMVRLNKKQSHAIPIKKDVFRDENCRKVKIEFMLEDVSQTKQEQARGRPITNRNNNGNNQNQDVRNVRTGGDGATYIAVDKKTKCQHEFLLCYQ
eukprot:253043_1